MTYEGRRVALVHNVPTRVCTHHGCNRTWPCAEHSAGVDVSSRTWLGRFGEALESQSKTVGGMGGDDFPTCRRCKYHICSCPKRVDPSDKSTHAPIGYLLRFHQELATPRVRDVPWGWRRERGPYGGAWRTWANNRMLWHWDATCDEYFWVGE